MQPLSVASLSIAASFSALFAWTGATTISSATAVHIGHLCRIDGKDEKKLGTRCRAKAGLFMSPIRCRKIPNTRAMCPTHAVHLGFEQRTWSRGPTIEAGAGVRRSTLLLR